MARNQRQTTVRAVTSSTGRAPAKFFAKENPHIQRTSLAILGCEEMLLKPQAEVTQREPFLAISARSEAHSSGSKHPAGVSLRSSSTPASLRPCMNFCCKKGRVDACCSVDTLNPQCAEIIASCYDGHGKHTDQNAVPAPSYHGRYERKFRNNLVRSTSV